MSTVWMLLLSDYTCALQRDILLQGRLYLSENWLCFYSNVFRGTKVLGKQTGQFMFHSLPVSYRKQKVLKEMILLV